MDAKCLGRLSSPGWSITKVNKDTRVIEHYMSTLGHYSVSLEIACHSDQGV